MSNSSQIKPASTEHTRVNKILLSALEKPALQWFSEHMPAWVTPDMLTILGFCASVLIAVSYWLCNYNSAFLWLASFGFLLNWFGDSLDGTLARFRKIERPKYGFFVDHTVDAVTETLVFVGLGLSPYVDLTLALFALIGYLLVSVLVYVYTYVAGEFRISYASLGPTEMRAIAILANTLIFFVGNPVLKLGFVEVTVYNLIVFLIVLLLFIGFLVVVLWRAHQLSIVDRKKS
jgi:archaetidylinositol phosphate synthase